MFYVFILYIMYLINVICYKGKRLLILLPYIIFFLGKLNQYTSFFVVFSTKMYIGFFSTIQKGGYYENF